MAEPIYKLIVNPEYKDSIIESTSQRDMFIETWRKEIEKYENIIEAIGKARGWGEHPLRYDLVIEAGIEALLKPESE